MSKQIKFKDTEIGMIPEDWEKKNLGEEIELCYGKGLPKKNRIPGPYPVFGSNGIVGSHNEFLVEGPGIIIGRKGSVGEVKFSKNNFWPIDTTYYLKVKKKGSIDFWYYFLLTLKLNRMNSHSAVPGLNRDMVYELKKKIPDEKEQHSIAKILSDLDSKIELLQKQNKTLEAIGQALFKHWFVDFEFPDEEGKPYKSSGGEMVFNEELGKEIPKGWEVKNVQDALVFEKGVEPGSKCYVTESSEDNVRFIRVGDISTPRREQTFIPLDLSEGKFCKEDDILLSLDATIGIVRIGMKGARSGSVRKVYSKEKNLVPKGYIYSLLKSKYIQDTIYTYANGTTILHAGKSLNYMDLPIPSKEVFSNFSKIAEPIFNKMINNIIKIDNLEQTRDSLLPKLMSGKIRVPVEGK